MDPRCRNRSITDRPGSTYAAVGGPIPTIATSCGRDGCKDEGSSWPVAVTAEFGGVMVAERPQIEDFTSGLIDADELFDSLDDLEIDVLIDDDGEPMLL